MGGGTLQLVTKGIETIYLTDNPEITFFKNIYRRYTNFSVFEHDLHFKAKFGFGNTNTIKIRNIADILYGLGLYIKLPTINLKFKDPIISNIKEIFERFDVKFTNVNNLNESSTLTNDILNNNFLPQIEDEQIKEINTVNVNNKNLQTLNNNYEIQPNIFEGEYKLLDSNSIDCSLVAVESSVISYIPENNEFTELYYLINIVDSENIILINNIIKNKIPNDIILKENGEKIEYNSKFLKHISIDTQENYEIENNKNWINLANSVENSSFKYIAVSKEKINDFNTAVDISISPNSILDSNGKLVLFEKPFNNEYYLVDTTGSNLNTNFITIEENDILKDGNNRKLFTKKFLDEFSVPEGTHTHIAVKIKIDDQIPKPIPDGEDRQLDLLDPNKEDNNYFIVDGTGKDLENDSIIFTQSDIIKTNENPSEIKYYENTFLESFNVTNLVTDEDFYLVNVGQNFDQTLTEITFNNTVIYKNSNEIIYYTNDFLSNANLSSGNSEYIAIKKSTLGSNPYFSGDKTVDIANNSIKNNNNEYILFPELDKTSGNLEPKYIAIKRRNLEDTEFTGDKTINGLNDKSFKGNTANFIKFDDSIENHGIKLIELFPDINNYVGYTRSGINYIKFPSANFDDNKSKKYSKLELNHLKKIQMI